MHGVVGARLMYLAVDDTLLGSGSRSTRFPACSQLRGPDRRNRAVPCCTSWAWIWQGCALDAGTWTPPSSASRGCRWLLPLRRLLHARRARSHGVQQAHAPVAMMAHGRP